MRIVRFAAGGKKKYGILEGNTISVLKGNPITSSPKSLKSKVTGETFKLSSVKLLAPCEPTKIVALGFNYQTHINERKDSALTSVNVKITEAPAMPRIFLKPSTAVIGPEDNIVLPKNPSHVVEFEGEMAVVIGKKAFEVSEKDAKKYVFGYTIMNDVSDRSAAKEDAQWNNRGKGMDTFAPMGPWIDTDINPDDLALETFQNGQSHQKARTSDLIFNVSKLISFISAAMTLLPGDIISTGTPAGPNDMKPGDVIEIKIEKIGTLKNTVIRHK